MKKTKQITVFSGCVVRDSQVLLVLRNEPECVDAHLKWEFPGGKVDFGETPEESVRREILEETGVEVKVKQLLPWVGTSYWDYEWGTQQTLCFVYLCEFVSQKEVKRDHHVEKIEWIKIEEISQLPSLPGTSEIIKFINPD